MKTMKSEVSEGGSFRHDHSDLKIEAPEFDDNIKQMNYIDWVQPIERIIELKEYNDEKRKPLSWLLSS